MTDWATVGSSSVSASVQSADGTRGQRVRFHTRPWFLPRAEAHSLGREMVRTELTRRLAAENDWDNRPRLCPGGDLDIVMASMRLAVGFLGYGGNRVVPQED